MFFSRFALLLVIVEYGCIAYGLTMQSSKLLYHVFIYGSPVNLFQTLLGSGSAVIDSNKFIVAIFIFHIVKYLTILKAQISDDTNWCKMIAIVLEIVYVAYSGYLLFF